MNWPLYKSLHARGLTQAKLSALTGINRSVLARILTNEPGRGKETRPKIIPHLTWAEVKILGWEADGWAWVKGQIAGWPRWETAECSTSNNVPLPEVSA